MKWQNKKLRLQWDSNPQSLGFEVTEHLRNSMRKENVFNTTYKQRAAGSVAFTASVVWTDNYLVSTKRELITLDRREFDVKWMMLCLINTNRVYTICNVYFQALQPSAIVGISMSGVILLVIGISFVVYRYVVCFSLCLSLSLSHTHTHARARTHVHTHPQTHARTHTHTHMRLYKYCIILNVHWFIVAHP